MRREGEKIGVHSSLPLIYPAYKPHIYVAIILLGLQGMVGDQVCIPRFTDWFSSMGGFMFHIFLCKVDKKNMLALVCLMLAFVLSACSQRAEGALEKPTPSVIHSPTRLPLEYYSPIANAQYVSKEDTLILRYGPLLNAEDIANLVIALTGENSGPHIGKLILADDGRTVIFKPNQAFSPGEQVTVQVNLLHTSSGVLYQPLNYTFTVATNQQTAVVASNAVPSATPVPAFPEYLTLPQDIPHYTVTVTSTNTVNEGYIFVAPFYWTRSTVGSYLLILDDKGQIVYYKSVADQLAAFDFKVLPNGYMVYYDQKDAVHVVTDAHYQVVGTYAAQNGYSSDLHDFLMTKDGYTFLMIADQETVDMSKIVRGGKKNAAVTGLVIQELDPHQNVIFEWRSWDHFAFSESTSSLTTDQIDLIHGNGLALTSDGNLLLSCRNLSSISKINLQTGNIMWRLGGNKNDFYFVNDGEFHFQHNIAVLPNGDITLFDNHGTDQSPAASRALEFQLDETNRTATLVWYYIHNPPVFTDYMGDVERLADGNTFIGWGSAVVTNGYVFSSMTEVTPDDQVVFELTFDQPYVSYRAFREDWVGIPDSVPDLAFTINYNRITLGYSWNGATEVASWNLYGGTSPQAMLLVAQSINVGFETQSHFTNLLPGECYFQVAAMDKNGVELARSEVVSTDKNICPLGN